MGSSKRKNELFNGIKDVPGPGAYGSVVAQTEKPSSTVYFNKMLKL